MPTLIECNDIPHDFTEIATPEVARGFPHLSRIADEIPPYNPVHDIGLLIGRDVLEVHHVHEQIVGPRDLPFAQRTCFGWVIIGEVCLDKRHIPSSNEELSVSSFKTYVLPNGRSTVFESCPSMKVKEETLEANIFAKHRDDDQIGLSTDDRQFLALMDGEMNKTDSGNLVAPLPFRKNRPRMPNNLPMAQKRAKSLDASLKRDPLKLQHFVAFMAKVFDSGAAEVAPPLPVDKEAWYLPVFGVYHPRKPTQIRGVFDSSAEYQNVSLNGLLLSGPNLTNSLLGILIRFRREQYAISADIEQMFYSFLVTENHRDYLRFLWYRDNDPEKDVIQYRMCAHVFGNSPSPAVATYGLRRSVQNASEDVKEFVNNNFYVDDGLISLPSAEQADSLLKRTQATLKLEGNIRLHKIASNAPEVMAAFPKEDLEKDLKTLDLEEDSLPVHRSLGMLWDLSSDCFTFDVQIADKPPTRRGFLSILNSIYDPLGLIAPLLVQGKLILREVTTVADWDVTLDLTYVDRWNSWLDSLRCLREVAIPRMYTSRSLSFADRVELHVFCDASEQAVAAVAYLLCIYGSEVETSFVFGKIKLAPSHGHTIPRLELCAALLATQVSDEVKRNLQVDLQEVRYYSDSKIVLGYICNKSRRFYNYVSNRVQRILQVSEPLQWNYIPKEWNPADHGTRGLRSVEDLMEKWIGGAPTHMARSTQRQDYPLVEPGQDKEVRSSKTTVSLNSCFLMERFEKFSTWPSLTRAVALLKSKARHYTDRADVHSVSIRREAEVFIVRVAQQTSFPEELEKRKTSTQEQLSCNSFAVFG